MLRPRLTADPPGSGAPSSSARPGRGSPCPIAPLQPRPVRAGPSAARPPRRPPLPPPRGILDAVRAATAGARPTEDEDEEEGDALEACPIGCVTEIPGAEADDGGLAAFDAALAAAPPGALVVVDFYKTACGACRYVAPGFVKLCKQAGRVGGGGDGSGNEADVIFLKHNILDEEGGRTGLAVREGVRAVPTFCFYRGGERLDESFPTRDRAVVAAAINRLVGREVL